MAIWEHQGEYLLPPPGGKVARITFGVLAGIGLLVFAAPAATARGGDPGRGKVIFMKKCSSCHTLRAAGTTGRVGPNLDKLKPSYARVIAQVTSGGTGIQSSPKAKLTFFKGELTSAQIRDVAAFVFVSTHT